MSAISSSDNTKMSAAPAKSSSKKSAAKTAEVAVPVSAPAPAPAKASKKEKAKAEKPVETPAVVAVAPVSTASAAVAVSAAPSAAVTVSDDHSGALQTAIAALQEQLTSLKTATSTAAASLKSIEKLACRVVKDADKQRKRRGRKATVVDENGNPKPRKSCVFNIPTKVSAELCAFLGKPKDTELARSDVTKAVIQYAKDNKLMDKQTINTDGALRKLLGVTEKDEVKILNLQKYLSKHYVKAVKPTTPAA